MRTKYSSPMRFAFLLLNIIKNLIIDVAVKKAKRDLVRLKIETQNFVIVTMTRKICVYLITIIEQGIAFYLSLIRRAYLLTKAFKISRQPEQIW